MPKKLMKSIKYARAGAKHAFATQRNLWIHFGVGVGVIGWAASLRVSQLEMAILVITIIVVIVTEMVNTAIEETINILSPEKREQAGLAKNVAAAAVLLAALGSLVIGCIIFIPRVR
ncbi:MAG: diacylglycerol kinase family protein [bacterium]